MDISVNKFRHEINATTRIFSKDDDLRIVIGGKQAGVSRDEKIIYLPSLPETATLTAEERDTTRGFIDHESAHKRFTPLERYARLADDFQAEGKPEAAGLMNALEDMRIERKAAQQYLGAADNMAATAVHTCKNFLDAVEADPGFLQDPRNYIGVAITYAGRIINGFPCKDVMQQCLDAMPKEVADYATEKAQIAVDAAKNLDDMDGLLKCADIAEQIYDELFDQEPEEDDEQNEPEPETGDDDQEESEDEKEQPEQQPEQNEKGDDDESDAEDSGSSDGEGDDGQTSEQEREGGSSNSETDANSEQVPSSEETGRETGGTTDGEGGSITDLIPKGERDEDKDISHEMEEVMAQVLAGKGESGEYIIHTDKYDSVFQPFSWDARCEMARSMLIDYPVNLACGAALKESFDGDRYALCNQIKSTFPARGISSTTRHTSSYANAAIKVLKELPEYTEQLERCLTEDFETYKAEQSGKLAVMSSKLERMLKGTRNRMWKGGARAGRLDARRLPQAYQGKDLVWQNRQARSDINTVVRILVDLSGSMQGTRLSLATRAIIALCEALERAGVKVEVIGHHNACLVQDKAMVDLEGGQYIDELNEKLKAGKIPRDQIKKVGRTRFGSVLNMPIIKAADQSVRQARHILAGLAAFSGGSNSDGEAIAHVLNRFDDDKEDRKVLLVLSDGQPNQGHLSLKKNDLAPQRTHEVYTKQVVATAESRGVQCVGIGICSTAVKQFYDNSVVLYDINELATTMLDEMGKVLLNGFSVKGAA